MKRSRQSKGSGKSGRNVKAEKKTIRGFLAITACTVAALGIAVGSRALGSGENGQVYAASDADSGQAANTGVGTQNETMLPTGIEGVASGVRNTAGETSVNRIGTSCEYVMVGQRVKKVENGVAEFNVSSSMESRVNDLDSKSVSMAATPTIMSDTDYDTLLRIVEAEAGTEDVKGRTLVANVIMNRVKNEEFPNTVTEVVWENTDGVPQFSPTYDGTISEVTISDQTREAVKQALEGVDYSEGALFFIQKSAAESHNVTWFEKDLKKLFKYGVHEFYTYWGEGEQPQTEAVQNTKSSESTENGESTENSDTTEDSVVQMVMNDISE